MVGSTRDLEVLKKEVDAFIKDCDTIVKFCYEKHESVTDKTKAQNTAKEVYKIKTEFEGYLKQLTQRITGDTTASNDVLDYVDNLLKVLQQFYTRYNNFPVNDMTSHGFNYNQYKDIVSGFDESKRNYLMKGFSSLNEEFYSIVSNYFFGDDSKSLQRYYEYIINNFDKLQDETKNKLNKALQFFFTYYLGATVFYLEYFSKQYNLRTILSKDFISKLSNRIEFCGIIIGKSNFLSQQPSLINFTKKIIPAFVKFKKEEKDGTESLVGTDFDFDENIPVTNFFKEVGYDYKKCKEKMWALASSDLSSTSISLKEPDFFLNSVDIFFTNIQNSAYDDLFEHIDLLSEEKKNRVKNYFLYNLQLIGSCQNYLYYVDGFKSNKDRIKTKIDDYVNKAFSRIKRLRSDADYKSLLAFHKNLMNDFEKISKEKKSLGEIYTELNLAYPYSAGYINYLNISSSSANPILEYLNKNMVHLCSYPSFPKFKEIFGNPKLTLDILNNIRAKLSSFNHSFVDFIELNKSSDGLVDDNLVNIFNSSKLSGYEKNYKLKYPSSTIDFEEEFKKFQQILIEYLSKEIVKFCNKKYKEVNK